MKDCMTTFTGLQFNAFEPEADKIRIEDIAHALSMMVRANGHFPQFFSVGQHCIQCAREALARNYVPTVALACLLHDGSEAYLAADNDIRTASWLCAGRRRGRTCKEY